MSDRLNEVPEMESMDDTVSPKRRNAPGKLVLRPQKIMIVNLYKDFKSKNPNMPYRQMMSEMSTTLGIGLNSVRNTVSEYKLTGTVSSPNKKRNKKCLFEKIDDLDRNGLRQKVHSFWMKKELPTLDKILVAVNEDPAFPNFKRTSLEEGRNIYYLDETWVNAGDYVDKLWVDKTIKSKHDAFKKGLTTGATNPTGKGKRLIVLHIGSHKGFLEGGLLCFLSKKNTGDYHDEMNSHNFHEWFQLIIPRLDPNSVIVLDNAPYHSVRTEKIPTNASKKDEILTWLISKGVIVDIAMFKPQLLAKVREIKGKYVSYVVDNMAKNAGHTVLRLPPYHCELNPIELAWAMVKTYVKHNNTTFNIDDVRVLLNTAIERVTSENWQNFIAHVITEEQKMTEVDRNMDEIIDKLEPCVLTITGDTTSDSSDF
ncbi:uncharacterized protein LOC132932705 [Metopolophium dirhodum]|uniref:uncharacterized protein LOC132932705 n=1 Tax=Metopolophium dirhodum TaxID=44670 RepID=UPI00298FC1AA|nr:uncharacterized protein LOC132932705 [Metopolophium dirhodum]